MNKFAIKILVITNLLTLLYPFTCFAIEFKGMSYTGWSQYAYSTTDSNTSLANMQQDGCQWVAVTVWWFQDTTTSTVIAPDYTRYSVDPCSVRAAVDRCHQLGMKVMLKPMLDIKTGEWRAYITPSTAWFDAYRGFIDYWADFAAANNCEMLCIGCELENSSSWSAQWRSIIADIRTRYLGPLTYAVNFYGEGNISWWDALDYIGIDAYYALTSVKNPTPAELATAWNNIANSLQSWRNYWYPNKKIIFTESGYSSYDGANTQPWAWPAVPPVDVDEQADCYRALLSVCSSRSWWAGIFWWNWETNPDAGGLSDLGFTPQNRPAEQVLKDYYITITGDMNDDRKVDLYDVSLLADYWPNQSIVGWPDFNNDKKIDFKDFAQLASNWRQSIPLP